MKLYRNAIILVIIVALMGGAYYFVNKYKKPADTGSANNDIIYLIDYTSDKVDSITLTSADSTIVVSKGKDASSWMLTAPAGMKGDSSKLSSIVASATSLTADKVVEENAADLAIYGLDKPVTVTVKVTDGTEKTLEIGSLTPTKDAYYVMMKGSPKVYTVSTYSAEQFILNPKDVKDKTLLALDPQNIISISMDRKGQNLFKAQKETDNWAMLAPIEGNVSTGALSPMLSAVAALTASSYEELDSSDLEKYGLVNPPYALEFATSSEKHKLFLGMEKTKGSQIYARFDDSKDVFVLDETPFSFLDKPLKEILDVFAYITNIDTVTKVEVTMDGKKTTMDLAIYKGADGKTDTEKDKFTLDGKDASGKNSDDKQPAREFYQSLIGISLDDIDLSDVPFGTPEISVKYYLNKAPGTMQVDYVSKDANYYYVFRNGKYAHIIVRKDKGEFGIQGMKDSLKKLEDFLAAQK